MQKRLPLLTEMSNVYLYRYNNYYNRQVKKLDTLTSYASYLISGTGITNPITGVNFNPNDGVDTELILNWNGDIPDYLIISEDNSTIASRWFVIEATRTRSKQFKMVLHRDVIVDNYTNVLNAPAFIEKAKVPEGNKLIYNQEDATFNQIKQSETLLKDVTGSAWIVGYISRKDVGDDGTTLTLTGKDVDYQGTPDYTYTSSAGYLDYWNKYSSLNIATGGTNTKKEIYGYKEYNFGYRVATNTYTAEEYICHLIAANDCWISTVDETSSTALSNYIQYKKNNVYVDDDYASYLIAALKVRQNSISNISNLNSAAETVLPRNSQSAVADILEDNGKLIYDQTNNKYYVIQINQTYKTDEVDVTVSSGNIYQQMKAVADSVNITSGSDNYVWSNTTGSQAYYLRYEDDSIPTYTIELIDASTVGIKVDLPTTANREHLVDAPYDMFCMPYGDGVNIYHNSVLEIANVNKQLMLCTAMSLAKEFSGVGFLYDIQLLPYCPLSDNYLTSDGDIDYKSMTTGTIYRTVDSTTTYFGRIFFLRQSDFSFKIAYSKSVSNIKVENQTDMYRLCSPNYNGMFEFNLAKNGGISYIDVDCTYKPYTPYIHLNPQFGNLYSAQDFRDARGLICGGDFSLPIVSDQWKTYEYSNKNYQNIFNRQIENMDVNHKYDMLESGLSAVTGSISGAVSGGLIGGVGGALTGGITSLAAGIGDQFINQAKYEESKSYATDIFNYQLGNIKALPDTLTKVSAFNTNNRIFPFIEFYTCTQEEKTAFQKKLIYNGMTVGAIDIIRTYKYDNELNFLKGKIIRLDNVADDYHTAATIANEIAKGVYI